MADKIWTPSMVEERFVEAADVMKRLPEAIQTLGRSAASVFRVHDFMQRRPIVTIQAASRELKLSLPTVGKSLEHLIKLGIVRELTGSQCISRWPPRPPESGRSQLARSVKMNSARETIFDETSAGETDRGEFGYAKRQARARRARTATASTARRATELRRYLIRLPPGWPAAESHAMLRPLSSRKCVARSEHCGS